MTVICPIFVNTQNSLFISDTAKICCEQENSRTGRIYHSQQIEQNGKMSCLFSDFLNKTKKALFAHKMKENLNENFDIQKYYKKNELKKIQNDL